MANSGGSSVVDNKTSNPIDTDWEPKLKSYKHFDRLTGKKTLLSLVKNPEAVAKHAFYPLISFRKKWTKFAPKGQKASKKDRQIKYAARKDAAIFSYYRSLLSKPYEAELKRTDLEHSVLAYRKIIGENGKGKSNIAFAHDVFSKIRTLEDCSVAALDLSKFFDRLDHKYIKKIWKTLIECDELDQDHYQVFKHLTKYSEIEMEDLLVELSIKGQVEQVDGKFRMGFLKHKSETKSQICYPDEFRDLLVKSD